MPSLPPVAPFNDAEMRQVLDASLTLTRAAAEDSSAYRTLGSRALDLEALRVHDELDMNVFNSTPAQLHAWHRLAHALHGNGRIGVNIIGGSMAAGMNCKQTLLNQSTLSMSDCAFANRLALGMRTMYNQPAANIASMSFAARGFGSIAMKSALHAKLSSSGYPGDDVDANLLLIDFSANDSGDPRQPDQLLADFEGIVRFLLDEHPSVALLISSSFFGELPGSVQNSAPEVYRAIAHHYGVPLVRYDAVIADPAAAWAPRCVRPNATQFIQPDGSVKMRSKTLLVRLVAIGTLEAKFCTVHPTWHAHQMLADVLLSATSALLRDARHGQAWTRHGNESHSSNQSKALRLPAPFVALDVLKAHSVCSRLLSHYSADDSFRLRNSFAAVDGVDTSDGNWSLYEDVPGKPGWISDGPGGGSISFALRFGNAPLAVLTYLLGYDRSLGEVEVRLQGGARGSSMVPPSIKSRVAKFDARREDGIRVTVPNTVVMDVASAKFHNYAYLPNHNAGTRYGGGDSLTGFSVKPNQNVTFKLTKVCNTYRGYVNGTCKFKVLSLITTDC